MENKKLLDKFAAFIKNHKLSTPEELKKDISPIEVNNAQIEEWRTK